MQRVVVLAAWIALAACGGKKGSSSAKEVRIAAAADLARAFEEVGPAFEKATGIRATVTPGSTGLLAKQIAERAPFDLFAAANISYVDEVVAAGACDGATKALYARGRLVVWARGADGAPATFANLADPKYARIGIANPDHAPYGKAAKQALQEAGIWDQVKDRLTFGENVQVPMQWAKAGEVDAAIVALSLAVVADGGSSIPVDPALHDPLDQAMVVCGTGPGTGAAKKFQEFLGSAEGREIMTRYGFLLPGEAAPETKGGSGGDRADSGSAAAVERLDEAAVRKLVDAWLAAQNADDFAAYQATYAERFTGVKRVGPRSWKFDRDGWFADRGKMFEAKAAMKVTADDVKIVAVGKMAVVDLVQTFLQAKFKDTGNKQLVIVETKDGLRIAREEMLRSALVDAPGAGDAPAFSVVADEAGRWLLVGDAADVDTRGKPTDGGGAAGFDYSAHTALALNSPLVGQTVTVFPGKTTCKISEVSVMSMLTPHFGTVQVWSGDEDGDGEDDGPRVDGDERTAEVASSGARYLAARIDDCGDGVIGVIGRPVEEWAAGADAGLEAQAEAAFRKLDEFAEIQDYFEDDGGKGEWTEHASPDPGMGSAAAPAGLEVASWVGPKGEALVVVSASRGEGCGSFEGALTAVFGAADGKELEPLGLLGELPEAVLDADADGLPELASERTIYTRSGDAYLEVSTVDLGYHDCPC